MADTLEHGITPRIDSLGRERRDIFAKVGEGYSEEVKREALAVYVLDAQYDAPDTVRILTEKYGDEWDHIPTVKTIHRWAAEFNKSILKNAHVPTTHKILHQALTTDGVEWRDRLKAVQIIQEQVEGKPSQQVNIDAQLNIMSYDELMKKPSPKQGNGEWINPLEDVE